MIKRIVGWVVLIPLCAVLVVFALANRHTVTLHFDPLSRDTPFMPPLDVPMFALIYAMLIVGIVLGGIAVWLTQGRNRREKRQYRRESENLAGELERSRKREREAQANRGLAPADDLIEME